MISSKYSFSIVLPVYNADTFIEKSIKVMLDFLYSQPYTCELILVDDGSTDQTCTVIEEIITSHPSVRLIRIDKNQGRGNALTIVGRLISSDTFLYMDCDLPLQIDLSQINTLKERLTNYDVVIASRFHKSSKIGRKRHRAIVSYIYRSIVHIVFPELKVTDPDVGFKGFNTRTFNTTAAKTDLKGWSWDLQFIVYANLSKHKITEIPLSWDEVYQSTSVNLLTDSISELVGIVYIRILSIIKMAKR